MKPPPPPYTGPLKQYYESKASAANANSDKTKPDSPNGSSDVGGVTSALAQALLNEGEIADPVDSDQGAKASDVDVDIPGGSTDATTEEASFTIAEIWATFKMIQVPALSVFNVFWVTIGVFPALTVEMQSTENCSSDARFFNDLFIPFLFVMFNLGDFTGRTLAGM